MDESSVDEADCILFLLPLMLILRLYFLFIGIRYSVDGRGRAYREGRTWQH